MRTSSPSPGTNAPAPLRVLVVDDIPEICSFYAAVFKRVRTTDVELTVQTDPEKAIALIASARYDLVISDFRMRGRDGIDVLVAARTAFASGRRVLMTGYNEIPTTIARIRQAGIDAYLQKPLRAQDLVIMMHDLIGNDPRVLAAYRARADELEFVATREEHLMGPSRPALGAS